MQGPRVYFGMSTRDAALPCSLAPHDEALYGEAMTTAGIHRYPIVRSLGFVLAIRVPNAWLFDLYVICMGRELLLLLLMRDTGSIYLLCTVHSRICHT